MKDKQKESVRPWIKKLGIVSIVMIGISIPFFIFALNLSTDQNFILKGYQDEVNSLNYGDCEGLVEWINDSYTIYDRNEAKEGVAKQAQDLFFARYDKAKELGCPNLVEIP